MKGVLGGGAVVDVLGGGAVMGVGGYNKKYQQHHSRN
jgi:hypothetical protein